MKNKEKEKEHINVLIDTDIGSDVDDLFALVFTLSRPEIETLGIITTHGNVKLRAKIVAKVLTLTKKKCTHRNRFSKTIKWW